jgi:hypothetical protein
MANFNTHTIAGTGISALCASALYTAGITSEFNAILFLVFGIIGTFLPDMDSDNDTSRNSVFNILGLILSIFILWIASPKIGIIPSLCLAIAAFLLFRFCIIHAFKNITERRGALHSLPIAIIFAQATAIILWHFFDFGEEQAWYGGIFIFLGYVIHLLLDELIASELSSGKVKRPMLRAIQVISIKVWWLYLAFYIIIGLLFIFQPPFNILSNDIFTQSNLNTIWDYRW